VSASRGRGAERHGGCWLARPQARAVCRRARRRPDEDVHAARDQGQPAVSARRAAPHAGGHRRTSSRISDSS